MAKSARKAIPNAPRQPRSPALSSTQPAQHRPLNYHTNINFWRGRSLSFVAAWEGLVYIVRTQPNLWIEIAAFVVVIFTGLWLGIAALEWAVLGLTVGLVLALEAVNTAIETVVDLVSPEFHPLAKIAKDTAAGALIIAVTGSVVVAAFIFGPKLWALVM